MATIVVGVGASAGGLEAMQRLFGKVRPNDQVAYVVAQHMGRGAQADLVVRTIQRKTALPVHLGSQGQLVEADSVYVIPAGCDGIVFAGCLKLLPHDSRRVSMPCIDLLLQSLADNFGSRGWAVILSGTGSDGAQGCRAVHKAGGSVVIQDPSEAGFAGMPIAATGPGCASVTLRANQIGEWIKLRLSNDVSPPQDADAQPEDLARVITRVRAVTGIDFTGYREETLRRRLISRRRSLELDACSYANLLLRDNREVQHLQRLFLVSLSSFWRDRESFEALGVAVMQRIAAKPAGEPLRAWVAGCASGEEAYTLAALLTELVDRQGITHPIEIVATDLNHEALTLARTGVYPHRVFREAPAGWAERWFTPVAEGYRIGPVIAPKVRFEHADIESEAAGGLHAGAMDLVSCRNLLIYFIREKQDRVIARFRHALRPDGLLFIGPAENLSPAAQSMFMPLNPDHRIFVRRL